MRRCGKCKVGIPKGCPFVRMYKDMGWYPSEPSRCPDCFSIDSRGEKILFDADEFRERIEQAIGQDKCLTCPTYPKCMTSSFTYFRRVKRLHASGAFYFRDIELL